MPFKVTSCSVEGYTWPRASHRSSHTRMASGNEPVSSASAVMMRLPSEWLSRYEKRCLNERAKMPS